MIATIILRSLSKPAAFLLLAITTSSLYAQKVDLNNAINHFESNNTALAEKAIDRAITGSFTTNEELSQAMYYYFLIKTDLYFKGEINEAHLDQIPKVIDSFNTCLKNDTKKKYTVLLQPKVQNLKESLLKTSQFEYQKRDFLKYFYIMDNYILIQEMTGGNGGKEYEKLANEAGKLGYAPLKIKYWRKMIKSNYKKKYAYQELMGAYYSLKKYKQVDNLLNQAKRDFPKTLAFAKFEISRLLDKEMVSSAMKLAKNTISKDPQNQEINFLLGLINSKLKEHELSKEYFEKVQQSNPDHFGANLELGRYYYLFNTRDGHLNQAKTYLEKAVSLNPRDKTSKQFLSEVTTKLGQGEL